MDNVKRRSGTTVRCFILALGLIPALAAPAASIERVLVNNGLAPPSPDNVLDDDRFANVGVYVRNVGCGEIVEWGGCPSPGDPTHTEMVDGGEARFYYVFDTSTITMLGGDVAVAVQAMGDADIQVRGGSIGFYLGAFVRSSVDLFSGNVDGNLTANNQSELSWYGGRVGGRLQADNSSVLNVFGHDFHVDGSPVGEGPILNVWHGVLTGTLASGEPIDHSFIHGAAPVSSYRGTIVLHILPPPAINIRPGSERNPVNPMGQGKIPVAILGSADFDVAEVDVDSLAFGPAGAPPAERPRPRRRDVNRDGFTDLVSHYETHETGIAFGDTEACLSGERLEGIPFTVCDVVTTQPACGIGFELVFLLPPLMWLRRRAIG